MLNKLGIENNILPEMAEEAIEMYKEAYPEVLQNKACIIQEIQKEYTKFSKTVQGGLKMANKYFAQMEIGECLTGEQAFKLYDTYGFPIEFTLELASEKEMLVDMDGFKVKYKEHQDKSRNSAAGKFKGGLAEHNQNSMKLHTATHLLNGALRQILGDKIYQKGSHISSERLRFDFSFDRKLTKDEIHEVENIVNKAIKDEVDVICCEMSIEEAKKLWCNRCV